MRARASRSNIAVILGIAALGGAIVTSASVIAATGRSEILLSINRSDEGTIKLGADPRAIPLEGDALGKIAARIGERRIYLVLDDVQAKQSPGILYDVFLDATVIGLADANRSRPVGHLNFYETKKRLLSFDVTDVLKRLASQGPSDRKLVVTIAPAIGENTKLSPTQQRELNEASVTLANVRLVGQ